MHVARRDRRQGVEGRMKGDQRISLVRGCFTDALAQLGPPGGSRTAPTISIVQRQETARRLTSLDLRLWGVSESFIVFPPRRKSSKSLSSSARSSSSSSSYDCIDESRCPPSLAIAPTPYRLELVDLRPRENDCLDGGGSGGDMGPFDESSDERNSADPG